MSDSDFGRQGGAVAILAALILVNSAAVAYLGWTVRSLQSDMRWATLGSIRSAATVAEGASTSEIGRTQIPVTLFSDFSCEFCRESAVAIDSARRVFGDALSWRYKHSPRPKSEEPASFYSATVGVCLEEQGLFWAYYRRLSGSDSLNTNTVDQAARDVGARLDLIAECLEEPSTTERVWSDLLEGAHRNIRGTPTVVAGGLQISGVQDPDVLIELLEDRLGTAIQRLSERSRP